MVGGWVDIGGCGPQECMRWVSKGYGWVKGGGGWVG
jgi:hypothetical protein